MQPVLQFWLNWVKVVTFMCPRSPAPHVARGWEKTLHLHGFPVQTYGKTSKDRNFNSKAWIKFFQVKSTFDPFCVPVQKLYPKCPQFPHELTIIFSTKCVARGPHTKQKKRIVRKLPQSWGLLYTMQAGMQGAVYTVFGKRSSTYPVHPQIFFMGKHHRCMASLKTLKTL